MGAKNSSTVNNISTTDVTNDFMSRMSTNISNTNSAKLDLNQKLTVRAPGTKLMDGCKLSIKQNQGGEVRASLQAMNNLTEEQKNELASAIANTQSAALSQKNSGISTPGTKNSATVNNVVITTVKNNIENIIEKTFENMNFSEGSGDQEATIDLTGLYCDGGEIKIDQKQTLKVVAENLGETVADTVQANKAVTEVTNSQTAEVKQSNEGLSMSGSLASSPSVISSIAIVALIAGAPMLSGAMDGMKKDVPPPPTGGGEMNYPVLIGGIIVVILLVVGIGYVVYSNIPEHVCPSEEDCSKAWDEIEDYGPESGGSGGLFRKYHNCRIRHRFNLIKPEKFYPRCETYCAHATRESENPEYSTNILKPLFCLNLMGDDEGGDGDGDGGGDGDGDGDEDGGNKVETDITDEQTETFTNDDRKIQREIYDKKYSGNTITEGFKVKAGVPKGYGEYY